MSNQEIKRAELIVAAKANASRNFGRLLATGKSDEEQASKMENKPQKTQQFLVSTYSK